MPSLRYLFALFALFVFTVPAASEPNVFRHKGIEADASRYETFLKQRWKKGQGDAAVLRISGQRQLGKDPRAASRDYASAVVIEDQNTQNWLGLARALLAIQPDPNNGNERYDLPVNASGAAYRAYRLAKDADDKAVALFVLAQAMQRRSYWRPAINALKFSLNLVETADVRAAYEDLRTQHGFRMTDYSTQSDVANPRICLQFSERLGAGGGAGEQDFAKYVSVDGKDTQALDIEQKQICLGGVEHGKRYQIQLRAGLPSSIGENLLKTVDLAIYVPDRKPLVRFTGKSYVLPARGQQGIPLVTVNTGGVDLEVYRIGDRNLSSQLENGTLERQLSGYDVDQIRNQTGAKIYKGQMDVALKLNTEVTTAFPVTAVIGTLKPGAYVMFAKPVNEEVEKWKSRATQWFIVSDLGLTAFSGGDGIHAFVRSLAEATPSAGAKVRLVARNNEVLARATTDAQGYVHFSEAQTRGEGGLQPATLIAENETGEYAFLDLRSNAFDLSDRGVKGRNAPGPIDGYLYTERGIYRPGEAVYLTALVRDSGGVAQGLPVTLIVTRPDGVEHARYVLHDKGLGGRSKTIHLSSGAMTGTWRLKMHTDPGKAAVVQSTFLVEDFVPERLAMTLTAGDGQLAPGAAQDVSIEGKYLYGPAAGDLALEGDIIVRPSKSGIANFQGYQFGRAGEKITPLRKPLDDLGRTDSDGNAVVKVKLPAVPRTAKPLEARVIVRLREPGGRSLERAVTLPVNSGQPRIGVKPLFDRAGLEDGGTATFDVLALDADNKRIAQPEIKWQLFRLDTSWQWYNSSGQWLYEPQTLTRKVASGAVEIDQISGAKIATPVNHGRYRLELTSASDPSLATSVVFNAGWFASGKSLDSPELLELALDKESYNPGEAAKLRVSSKAAGKVLLAVLGSRLHMMKEVAVEKGGTDIILDVGENWGAGAYATALFYRPMHEAAKRMPSRSVGVQWISVDQARRTLDVTVDAPAKVKSGAELVVPVAIKGMPANEKAFVTVAAVDVGILNVTGHASPQPQSYFYAQQKLAFEIRDFYGRLIDGMRAERGRMRSGGDAGSALEAAGAPPVEETVAFYSGIVEVNTDGEASVSFPLPDFNGTVRIMAVAWTANKVGSASQDVTVRDAIALTVSGPRFLILGDKARLAVSIHNVEAPVAEYSFTANVNGGADPLSATPLPSRELTTVSIPLKANERILKPFTFEPSQLGLHRVTLRVTGEGGIDVQRHLTFDVKPPSSNIKTTTVAKIAAKGGTLRLARDLVTGMIDKVTTVNVSVGPSARFDVPSLLTALDRYPYGCAEQTVSRALPLLYANAVAAELGLGSDDKLKVRIQAAISRVFELQDSSGAFGAWGPFSTNVWLTSYVMDFLSRAKEQGYQVKDTGFALGLDRLQNYAVNAADFESGGEARAYALYVLARNARAPIGELRYYADARLDRFSTPLAKAQIGAALAMMGDQTRAGAAFAAAVADLTPKSAASVSRADYGSELRDGAALLTLVSETGVGKAATPRLLDVVGQAYQDRTYTSTQEQAWMLLAVNALQEDVAKTRLALDGAPVSGSLIKSFSTDSVKEGRVITNNGDEAIDAVISVMGASTDPQPPTQKGFSITRRYFTLSGEAVEVASADGGVATMAQNKRLVVVVDVESDEDHGQILVVDHLPAGLEVENPRLVDSGDVKALSWLKPDIRPQHSEFRDDRVVAAFTLKKPRTSPGQDGTLAATKPKVQVAYVVRAVTPGAFVHPAVTVEDMYRPERYARSAAGQLTITASE